MGAVEAFFGDRSSIGVHQRRKVFELRNQYELTNEDGTSAGRVEQAKQSPLAFILRLASSLDVALPVTLTVTDASGGEVLTLHKPWFTWKVAVRSGGRDLGSITRKLRIGKPVYVIAKDGTELGEIRGEDWRSRHFQVVDAQGQEVGRVTKQWRGILTEAFTDADSYGVELAPHASVPQRAMVLAGALTVDLVQKQKDSS
jgi:uncharacterized protein YxjI